MRYPASCVPALILLFFLTGCNDNPADSITDDRPNVLFIFTDDQTYTALHALGNHEIETPHLDQLVTSGTTFTHAYNMGAWNGAVCAASRAMINSGRYLWRAREQAGRYRKNEPGARQQTWAPLMAAAGYRTYMSGKWHVDFPAPEVFDTAAHIRKGMPDDGRNLRKIHALFARFDGHPPQDSINATYAPAYNRPLSKTDDRYDPTDPKFGGYWEGGKHWSEVLADDAEIYLAQAAADAAPFFMYLAFNAPHDPKQAPAEYLAKYTPEELSVPASFQPVYPNKEKMGNGRSLRDEALAPYPRTAYAVRKHKQEYYALITHLDAQIGRILAALKATGKADNTVIMFTADHGLAMGNHGLMGKQSLYDHSIRVPLIITGPGIPQGAKNNADVYLQDVMPTALDLAGVEKPDYVEFNSLLPLIRQPGEGGLDAVYGAYINVQRSIRKDGWKLLVYPKVPEVKLFDLGADPDEINNLATTEPARVEALFAELQELQKSMGDTLRLVWEDYR